MELDPEALALFTQGYDKILQGLGYSVDWRMLCAADYGDPTTRTRFFLQAVRGGAPQQARSAPVTRCMSSLPGPGSFSMNGGSISSLVTFLPQLMDRQVIDRTGLTSIYDLTLKWMPEPVPSALGLAPVPLPPPDPDAPNIFTAVQEQLGLKLEPGRGPVEVIVIDRLEKPAID